MARTVRVAAPDGTEYFLADLGAETFKRYDLGSIPLRGVVEPPRADGDPPAIRRVYLLKDGRCILETRSLRIKRGPSALEDRIAVRSRSYAEIPATEAHRFIEGVGHRMSKAVLSRLASARGAGAAETVASRPAAKGPEVAEVGGQWQIEMEDGRTFLLTPEQGIYVKALVESMGYPVPFRQVQREHAALESAVGSRVLDGLPPVVAARIERPGKGKPPRWKAGLAQ